MDDMCAVVRLLAEWIAAEPSPPVVFAAYHRSQSQNRPASYLGLVYQDGAVCPWWELGGVRHRFPPDHLGLLIAHRGSQSAPVNGPGGLWLATLDVSGTTVFDEVVAASAWNPLRVRQPVRLTAAFQRVAAAYLLPRPTRQLHLKASLLELCATVLDDAAGTQPASSQVQQALDFLHGHFRDVSLDLPRVAAAACLSVHHFGRAFRAATGTTPMRYLQELRIRQARGLLATTELQVKEVAVEVGFGDPLHFSRVFRQVAGLSPREYRQGLMSS